jgi:hypothetical protein
VDAASSLLTQEHARPIRPLGQDATSAQQALAHDDL